MALDGLLKADKLTEDHKTSLEKYSSLFRLTLNKIGLTSLENFPQLKELQVVSNTYNYFLLVIISYLYLNIYID